MWHYSRAMEHGSEHLRKPSILNPAFPEKLLFDGEVVSVDLKPHWWHFAQPGGATVLTVALWLLALSRVSGDMGSTLSGRRTGHDRMGCTREPPPGIPFILSCIPKDAKKPGVAP